MVGEAKRMIEKTPPTDIDGHTEVSRETPDERLSWLDEVNANFLELHALTNPVLHVAEESPKYGPDAE
jgi:hypothetical protein